MSNSPETEKQLIEAALAGDRTAFDHLVGEYLQVVRLVYFARLNDRDEADDLTQETFLRAFRGPSTLRELRYPKVEVPEPGEANLVLIRYQGLWGTGVSHNWVKALFIWPS